MRKRAAVVLGLAVVLAVTGCTPEHKITQETHATRVKFYHSEDQLAAASAAIVVGSVKSQRVTKDIDELSEFTLSTVEVSEVLKGGTMLAEDDLIVVRQHGGGSQPSPGPILEADGTFLLYLTPSGLPGELAAHFYITGATAGIYESLDDGAPVGDTFTEERFERLDEQSGDNLPDVIDIEDATQ